MEWAVFIGCGLRDYIFTTTASHRTVVDPTHLENQSNFEGISLMTTHISVNHWVFKR